ncbi:RHS repeat-associated core domain-containing protein [Sphaerisporangium sp. NPDC051017]|uniref:RHS repeat-associated core domain-containing protein n=1 Tax=Sphaerisporangium sp. NPDC051017 TaxID=3154636 RepID=UPI00344434ED
MGYDPYGAPTTTRPANGQALGYQGEWTDPATGRVDMHARWYTPETGTFASRDSASVPVAPAAGANTYGYGGANPLSMTDPTGHLLESLFGTVANHLRSAAAALRAAGAAISAAQETIAATARYTWWLGTRLWAIAASQAVRTFLLSAARQVGAAIARTAAGIAVEACFASVVCGLVVVGAVLVVSAGALVYYFSRQPDGSLAPVAAPAQPQTKPQVTEQATPQGGSKTPKGSTPTGDKTPKGDKTPTGGTGSGPKQGTNGAGSKGQNGGKQAQPTGSSTPVSGGPTVETPKPPPPPVVTSYQYTTYETSSTHYYDANYIYDRVDDWSRTYQYTITTYHDGATERSADRLIAWTHSWTITRTATVNLNTSTTPEGGSPPPVYPLTLSSNGEASPDRPCGDGGTVASCLPKPLPAGGGCATSAFSMAACSVQEPAPGQAAPVNPTVENPTPANPQPGGTGANPPRNPPAGNCTPDPTGDEPGNINPNSVRFTQNSVSRLFKSGHSIEETASALASGALSPTDLDPIRLVERNGNLYTLDNRRLVAYQKAGIESVPYRMATPAETRKEWRKKFTTETDGRGIQIRGDEWHGPCD